jgi:hypothetical protein
MMNLHDQLVELGRRLASTREDLIVLGSDPDDLAVPVHPDDPEDD